MLQRRGYTNLPGKALGSDARGEDWKQNLDDDRASEPSVAGDEDATHTAAAKLAFDRVDVTKG
jgi:hypothetical protein